MKTASVFVNIPVKSIAKAYTYLVPAEYDYVQAGWRVLVPFGGRKVEGFILATANMNETELQAAYSGVTLKNIQGVVDEESWFSEAMIKTAKWLANFYLCSLAEMMRLFMPGKSGLKISVRYDADDIKEDHILLNMPQYRAIVTWLKEHGPASKNELRLGLSEKEIFNSNADLTAALTKLINYKLVTKDYAAAKRDKALKEKWLVLNKALDAELRTEFKRKRAQLKAMEILAAAPAMTMRQADLKAQQVSDQTIRSLCAAGKVTLKYKRVLRDSYKDVKVTRQEIALTADQQKAIKMMESSILAQKYQGFLLKGVTGSGKTQVYIEMAKKVRHKDRQVIVLVPEIALTGQVVSAFKAYFPQDIVVMHSRLSLAERNDAIIRVRRQEAGIVIGARSALFTPVADAGLIIIDEEQDLSYKQDESPRYHARVVAEEIAKIHQAVLLLGSATPSLETYYRAKQGEFTLIDMPKRIGDMPLPVVKSVDMRQELRRGNRHIVSNALRELIEQTIAKKKQLIIMLNRRGFSTFVMCRSCGEVIKCKECGLPLVYHKSGKLACHHCDISEKVPDVCPKCGSRYIKYFGSGTEKLEQELQEIVPSARVIRMDRDTTSRKFAHQDILNKFRQHEYDILLGTQMVAKGHDIPDVTAVGIISADSALNMPDFRASERTFMLITQTAGRAGRHSEQGKVIIQTYNPEHYAVTCGMAQDYEGFYEKELFMRQQMFYPPYSRLLKLLFQHEDENKAKANAEQLAADFERCFAGDDGQQLAGPAPAVIACLRGIYRYVLLIKTADIAKVQQFLREQKINLRNDIAIDIDPISTL